MFALRFSKGLVMSRHTQEVRALKVNFQHLLLSDDIETIRNFMKSILEVLEDTSEFDSYLFTSGLLAVERDKIINFLQASNREDVSLSLQLPAKSGNNPISVDNDDTDSDEYSNITVEEMLEGEIEYYVDVAMRENNLEALFTWCSLSILRRVAYRTGELKRIQQIMAVEIFHSLIDTFGIKYFDPRRSRGFQEYINRAMGSGMIKFSPWLSKDAIRAYRNAEQSGRLFEITKLPAPDDRSKVIDYYSFNEGGRATALKDLRNLGISEKSLIELANLSEFSMPDVLDSVRRESSEVGRRIQELVSRPI